MKEYPVYSRKDENNNFQTLDLHLDNVARLSESFTNEYMSTVKLAALLHDIGKVSNAFQEYLINGGIKGSVVHSMQGTFCVSEISTNHDSNFHLIAKELLEMIIASHHGSLYDAIDIPGDYIFFDRLENKSDEKYHYDEVVAYFNNLDHSKIFENCTLEIQKLIFEIKQRYKNKDSANFALGLYMKYMFSCLVDADRLDAYLFEIKSSYDPMDTDWKRLTDIFEKNISKFNNSSTVNRIRREISDKCMESSNRNTGIYRLSVPTGGGKTLSSLRFALHHAMKRNKKRIIYVIPYLSITTQTTANIRDILELDDNSDLLLEHYSGIAIPETEEEINNRKLAASRWHNPIIVTTMVQFLETVMSAKGSDLRKFHNMENSIIIFDEIQSLPISCVHLFNESISFLSKILNTTILLCTATQPMIDQTNRRNLLLSDNPDLIDNLEDYEEKLKRTNIVYTNKEISIDEFAEAVFERAKENDNCLCIVNLKSEARKIYELVRSLDLLGEFRIIHLSTAMCGEHRRLQLDEVKHCLDLDYKVICISTQLIEAGVDISFSCVVRAMAGLDSIFQAAGRCNRNGEFKSPKNVYTYAILDEKGIEKLPDIKMGKEITQRVIRENPDTDYLKEESLRNFYHYYFYMRFDEMDYITKDGTVYDMLSTNNAGRNNYKNRTGVDYPHFFSHAFSTASEKFSVIPDLTKTVVVYFGESEQLLENFKTANIEKKVKMLRMLQGYTISLFEYEFSKLDSIKAISLFDNEYGIYVLAKDFYSSEYGVDFNAEMQNLVI